MLYVQFWLSEGIADRGEVPYPVWEKWQNECPTFGPFADVRAVYTSLCGLETEDGFPDTLALFEDGEGAEYDGYWRVVRKVVTSRGKDGRERSSHVEVDPAYPPFSDWFISTRLDPGVKPLKVAEVDRLKG